MRYIETEMLDWPLLSESPPLATMCCSFDGPIVERGRAFCHLLADDRA
jgi:hypothetical protein